MVNSKNKFHKVHKSNFNVCMGQANQVYNLCLHLRYAPQGESTKINKGCGSADVDPGVGPAEPV